MVHPTYLATALLAVAVQFSGTVAQYTATYDPNNLPATTEDRQYGTNKCGTSSNQTSLCQNAYINSINDFCLWAPPDNKTQFGDSAIGNTERFEISWCLQGGYGTRLIPQGTITGAHWVQTPNFVQVTGIGDFTKVNIPASDTGGGELDPHGADGLGNPIGGLVFSSAFGGKLEQIHEWTQYISVSQFCFRACSPTDAMAPTYCQHVYDVLGCNWNMPADYSAGYDSCAGDSGEPMGVYGGSTFFQGQEPTPAAHPVISTSSCTSLSTISLAAATMAPTGVVTSASSSSSSGAVSSGQASKTNAASTSKSTSSVTSVPAEGSSAAIPGHQVGSSSGLIAGLSLLSILVGAFVVAI